MVETDDGAEIAGALTAQRLESHHLFGEHALDLVATAGGAGSVGADAQAAWLTASGEQSVRLTEGEELFGGNREPFGEALHHTRRKRADEPMRLDEDRERRGGRLSESVEDGLDLPRVGAEVGEAARVRQAARLGRWGLHGAREAVPPHRVRPVPARGATPRPQVS